MNHDQKSLVLGILVGILISSLLFGGGIFLWIQASSRDLKIPANQPTSISIGGLSFDFVYFPNSARISLSNRLDQNDSIPANVGYVYSWSWGGFSVTEVNPDYVILHFRPLRFSSIQDVPTQFQNGGVAK
jgi:hypothetical protein